jgi:putative transposase
LYLRNQKKYRCNHKRVYRIYCELELNMRIHSKKRLLREKPVALTVPEEINQVWSMEFMHDLLSNSRCYGPENISHEDQQCAQNRCIRLEYIEPCMPQQNAFVELFNRTVRFERLPQQLFDSIEDVQ